MSSKGRTISRQCSSFLRRWHIRYSQYSSTRPRYASGYTIALQVWFTTLIARLDVRLLFKAGGPYERR